MKKNAFFVKLNLNIQQHFTAEDQVEVSRVSASPSQTCLNGRGRLQPGGHERHVVHVLLGRPRPLRQVRQGLALTLHTSICSSTGKDLYKVIDIG